MGCQYAIANQIVKKEDDYIFALKGNQSSLSDDVKLYFENKSFEKSNIHTDYDKAHGRIETRECGVVSGLKWLRELHPNWQSINAIIEIKSTRKIGDTTTQETRYYISSMDAKADKILKAIRSHWAIENSLHWVLDMSFNEDYSRIRKENAPHIMTIFRHIALNLLQTAKKNQDSLKSQSIVGLRKLCGWDEQKLDLVIAQKIS